MRSIYTAGVPYDLNDEIQLSPATLEPLDMGYTIHTDVDSYPLDADMNWIKWLVAFGIIGLILFGGNNDKRN